MSFKHHYSQQDWNWTKELIGRPPQGLHRVMCYHPQEKHPMVIQVTPWNEGRPFPTLYWLTCPLLKKEISHLEKEGWIKKIEEKYFPPGSRNLEILKENHHQYRQERIELFERENLSWDKIPPSIAQSLRESGIGGIRDFRHIKCLHLHYAHHLARNNRVGEILDELFNLKEFTH